MVFKKNAKGIDDVNAFFIFPDAYSWGMLFL